MVGKSKSALQEFVAFVKGFGVIGLAIGVVIGGAVNTLVGELTKDIISPLLGYVVGGVDFASVKLGNIMIGSFVGSLINFLILVAVVWVGVKVIVGRMLTAEEKEKLGM